MNDRAMRADLLKMIRIFVGADEPALPSHALLKHAADQIEADGARETALLDISARFAEMTARAIKAEAEYRALAEKYEAEDKRVHGEMKALEAELKILRAQVSSDDRPGVTLVFP